MIGIDIGTADFDRADRLMQAAPKLFIEQMRLANMEASKALHERITAGKLRGEVLRRISGKLIGSWAAKVPPTALSDGWLGGAGTNLNYAIAHEFGVHKEIHVRAHERRAARTRTASGRFRRRPENAESIHVDAFSYRKDYRGKPYARPSLEEIRDKVKAIHRDRITKAEEKLKATV